MNLLPLTIAGCVLLIALVAMIIYRRAAASGEDDMLHVEDPTGAVTARQTRLAQKLEKLDLWVKILTVIVILWGLGLGAAYLYNAWIETSRIG